MAEWFWIAGCVLWTAANVAGSIVIWTIFQRAKLMTGNLFVQQAEMQRLLAGLRGAQGSASPPTN